MRSLCDLFVVALNPVFPYYGTKTSRILAQKKPLFPVAFENYRETNDGITLISGHTPSLTPHLRITPFLERSTETALPHRYFSCHTWHDDTPITHHSDHPSATLSHQFLFHPIGIICPSLLHRDLPFSALILICATVLMSRNREPTRTPSRGNKSDPRRTKNTSSGSGNRGRQPPKPPSSPFRLDPTQTASQTDIWSHPRTAAQEFLKADAPPPPRPADITYVGNRHALLCELNSSHRPQAKALLLYHVDILAGSSDINLQATKLFGVDLLNTGYHIGRDNFALDPDSASQMLSRIRTGQGQIWGDLGSTANTFARGLDLAAPQTIGDCLATDPYGTIPAYLYVKRMLLPPAKQSAQQLTATARTQAPDPMAPDGSSQFEVVPLYTARDDSLSMQTIQTTTSGASNWVHVMNFALLKETMRPAFATLCNLLRDHIYTHVPEGVSRAKLYELLVIKTVHLHLDGNNLEHLKELAPFKNGPSLAIYMKRDPHDPTNHSIYEAMKRACTLTSRGTVASANFAGLHGIFIAPRADRNPLCVDADHIPRGLPRQPQYWLLVSGAPPWCTPVHLNLILERALGIHEIHLIFSFLDMYNAPQAPIQTRQQPSLVISFHTADQIKQVFKSVDLVRRVISNLGPSDNSVPLEFTTMPGTNVKSYTDATPSLVYTPLTRETLELLVSAPELVRNMADETDGDLDDADDMGQHTVLLPPHCTAAALDTLRHQLDQDPTSETLARALSAITDHIRRDAATAASLAEYLPRLCGTQDLFPQLIKHWVELNAVPDFQLVDTRSDPQATPTSMLAPPQSPHA